MAIEHTRSSLARAATATHCERDTNRKSLLWFSQSHTFRSNGTRDAFDSVGLRVWSMKNENVNHFSDINCVFSVRIFCCWLVAVSFSVINIYWNYVWTLPSNWMLNNKKQRHQQKHFGNVLQSQKWQKINNIQIEWLRFCESVWIRVSSFLSRIGITHTQQKKEWKNNKHERRRKVTISLKSFCLHWICCARVR